MTFLQQGPLLKRAFAVVFSLTAFTSSQHAFAGGTANDNQGTMALRRPAQAKPPMRQTPPLFSLTPQPLPGLNALKC